MELVIPGFSGALTRCHFCPYPVLSVCLFSHSFICLLTHNYSNAERSGKIAVYGVKVTQSGKSNETTIWTGADRNATVHTTGSNKHVFSSFSCFHVNTRVFSQHVPPWDDLKHFGHFQNRFSLNNYQKHFCYSRVFVRISVFFQTAIKMRYL